MATVASKYAWLKDAAERFCWTIAQIGAGVFLDQVTTGEVSWRAFAYAAGVALAKLVVARQVGNPASAAIPETRPEVVVEAAPATASRPVA